MAGKNSSDETRTGLESYARLRIFMGKRGGKKLDMGAAFGRVAKELAKGECETGTLQIVVGGNGRLKSWVLEVTASGCDVKPGAAYAPRFEMVVRASAVRAMLSGDIAPITAMARRDMRVRGDLEFGKAIYKLLAADEGRIDPCQ